MNTLYQIALVTHISGLTMMAGTTLVDYLITKQFWKRYLTDGHGAVAVNESGRKLTILFALGILLLILSGVVMMGITGGVFGEQIWFQIKFCLVILVIINGLSVGRRQGSKLKKLLSHEESKVSLDVHIRNSKKDFVKIKRRLNLFHISQLLTFLVIFILSIFKFN